MEQKAPRSAAEFFPHIQPFWPDGTHAGPQLVIDQIAIVVDDIQHAMRLLASVFGWAPWYPVFNLRGTAGKEGEQGAYCIHLAFAQIGPIEVELVQPVEGNTPHLAHFAEKGAGLFHLRLVTENIEDAISRLAARDIRTIWDFVDEGVFVAAYTDSHKVMGFRTELTLSSEALKAKGFDKGR